VKEPLVEPINLLIKQRAELLRKHLAVTLPFLLGRRRKVVEGPHVVRMNKNSQIVRMWRRQLSSAMLIGMSGPKEHRPFIPEMMRGLAELILREGLSSCPGRCRDCICNAIRNHNGGSKADRTLLALTFEN
jgi:hypothetical protein